MSQTNFDGPLASGNKQPGSSPGPNVGLAVLVQTLTINQNGVNPAVGVLYLPPGSQILEIVSDVIVPFDSATSAAMVVGNVPGGNQYYAALNVKTGGRPAPASPVPAAVALMADIGANTAVHFTITPVGATTVGQVKNTVLYVQKA